MKRSARLAVAGWLSSCLAMILAGAATHLGPAEQALFWPGPGGLPLRVVTAVTATAALLLLAVAWRKHNDTGQRRALVELAVLHSLLFGFIWLLLPVGRLRPVDWLAGTFLAAAALLLALRSPGRPAATGTTRRRDFPVDLALVLLPVAVGIAWGIKPDLRAAGLSILLYPLYALLQLAVFLVIPATRLVRLGVPDRWIGPVCALGFGLVHMPNPVLMPVTAAAMFIWVRQYLAGRPVWQLALVMGLAATTFSQFLDDDFTRHMQTGPYYLRSRVVPVLARATSLSGVFRTDSYLAKIYPATIGRAAEPEELGHWRDLIDRARRTTMAWQFYTSPEYAARSDSLGWPPAPDPAVHWVDFPPEWRSRVLAFDSPEYWARCGNDLRGFTKCLYRDILQRPGSSTEIAAWNGNLTEGQRKRLAWLLLENRRRLERRPFTGMSLAELRFPR